ncbi:MAG TPA: hypothetical protein VHW09_12240 [Bryobacteraceae bacterium]|jgi:hypothetical protein|nr:hypothetical protein [Bryobacteraceae bacterium]
MKNFLPAAAAFVVLGAAGLTMPHAFAQPMWDQVKVHLPYSVTLGDKTIPPGDYLIKQLESADGNSPVLLIYGKNGMKFQTSAMTVHDAKTDPARKTDVTLHHIGDNYYLDKIWIAGKMNGYEIPLPRSVRAREAEMASVTVPSESSSSTETSTTASTDNNATTTTSADNSSTTDNSTATTPPPPPPPVAEPTPAPQPPAPEPQASTTPQPPDTTAATDNSANREQEPAPAMPKTSAGWLTMLLSGGTLSGAGMMLRRRKRS